MLETIGAVIVILFALQDLIGGLYTTLTNLDKFVYGFLNGLHFRVLKLVLELVVDCIVIYICIKFITLI